MLILIGSIAGAVAVTGGLMLTTAGLDTESRGRRNRHMNA